MLPPCLLPSAPVPPCPGQEEQRAAQTPRPSPHLCWPGPGAQAEVASPLSPQASGRSTRDRKDPPRCDSWAPRPRPPAAKHTPNGSGEAAKAQGGPRGQQLPLPAVLGAQPHLHRGHGQYEPDLERATGVGGSWGFLVRPSGLPAQAGHPHWSGQTRARAPLQACTPGTVSPAALRTACGGGSFAVETLELEDKSVGPRPPSAGRT